MNTNSHLYKCRTINNHTLQVTISGEIENGCLMARNLKAELDDLPGCTLVKLSITSPGGDIFEAMATYDVLSTSSARIEGEINHLAAGASTLIAMACDKLSMASNALMLISGPRINVIGNKRTQEETLSTLALCEKEMLNIYAKKTRLSHEELKPMMEAETWLDADLAVLKGFVDNITPAAANTTSIA